MDWKFIDKLIKYRGVTYLAQPIYSPDDVKKRGASFVYEAVSSRIDRDREACDTVLNEVLPLMYGDAMRAVPDTEADPVTPYWRNGFFSGADARFAYAFTALRKPARIVEIGVGNSTRFFRKSVAENGLKTKITCIDPNPRAAVSGVADQVIQKSVVEADLELFSTLRAGDFVFWDGSHVVFSGTDVVMLFLEILPILPPGVFVHVHDIFLPFDSIHNPEVGDVSYSEQYMLATYLINNKDCQIIAPMYYWWRNKRIHDFGGSFWFKT